MKTRLLAACAALLIGCTVTVSAAWQAGLQGGTVAGASINKTAMPAATNVYLGPHVGATQTKPPWADYTTWVYWGQVYLGATNTWFAENIDDAVYMRIWNGATPTVLLDNGIWNVPTAGSFTAPSAGWYPVEIRMWNGGSGAGPVVGSGWTATKGFGFKIGGTSSVNGADYTYPEDDGLMSFFRHDDGLGFDDALYIAGDPENYGTVLPPYGVTNGLETGDSFLCSAPTGTVAVADGTRARCAGYALYTNETVLAAGGTTNALWYTHDLYATLVWQWERAYAMAFTAGAGGSLSTTGGWYAAGSNVTVTATPAEGYAFSSWTGNVPEALRYQATLVFPAAQPVAATANFASVYYVRTDGSDAASGLSWAAAKQTVEAAVAAAGSAGTILVSNGVHNINAIWLQVNQPLTIRGVNGPDVTALKAANVNYAVNKYRRVMLVNHPGAFISGFTLSNGWHDAVSTDGDGPGALRLLSGTVSNCVVRDNMGSGLSGGVQVGGGLLTHCVLFRNTAYRSGGIVGYGGGVTVVGGTVRSCVITNNAAQNSGSGLYQTGGLVQECLIADNAQLYGDTGSGGGGYVSGGVLERCVIRGNLRALNGGGLYVNGSGAMIRNCLVTANRAYNNGAGVALVNGSLLNCTIAGNQTTIGRGEGLYMTAGTARNSIIYANGRSDYLIDADNAYQTGGTLETCCTYPALPGTGNLSSNPLFIDPANGDYRLAPGSPCLDAGENLAGITNDLLGGTRPLDGDGDAVAQTDMGAYEAAPLAQGEVRCGFTVSPEEGADSLETTLTAYVAGADTTIVWYGWDFENDGIVDASGADQDSVVHEYAAPGRYDVLLVVSNASGARAEARRVDCVRVAPRTVYVNNTGNDTWPYNTPAKATANVQAAIDTVWASKTTPGSVIVDDGEYPIPAFWLIVKRPIRMQSVNGPAVTRLKANGGSARRVMYVNHPVAVVSGFTMWNGWLDTYTADDAGPGGLRLTAGTVTNCIIRDNRGADGSGGVDLRGGLLTHCVIHGNTAARGNSASVGLGGGIRATGGLVEHCVISNNLANASGSGVYLSGAAVIRDSLITANRARYFATLGGGAYLAGGLLERCRVSSHQNFSAGGGLYLNHASATARNCLLTGNHVNGSGGGVYLASGTLQHATVAENLSNNQSGSGLYQTGGTVENSVFSGNGGQPTIDVNGNVYRTGGVFNNNCTRPAQAGTGNVAADPLFTDVAAGDFGLMPGSPCLDTAAPLAAVSNDLNRTARPLDGDGDGGAQPDMGCLEALSSDAGALRCGFTVAPEEGLLTLEPAFTATVHGAATNGLWYGWDFDGDGSLDASGAALRTTTHAYAQPGFYTVTLVVSNDLGTGAQATRADCVRVSPATTYVSTDGLSLAPYDTWGKAATNLQDAIDALLPLPGAPLEVVVSNGTHDIRAFWAQVLAPITIRSLNGPAVTTLRAANPGQPNWRRVLFVNHSGALITGFTMTGGSVLDNTGDNAGPGALRLLGGTVSNCFIRDNIGSDNSGGVELGGGLLTHCTVANNRAYRSNNSNVGLGGGVWVYGSGAMRDCVVTNNQANVSGGGLRVTGGSVERVRIGGNTSGFIDKTDRHGGGLYQTGGSVTACALADNRAYGNGGGAYLTGGALRSSLVVSNLSNTAAGHGHGLYLNGSAARLENVTAADNSCGTTGSGLYLASGKMTNSIAWFNGTSDLFQTGGTVGYSCWSGAPASNGNTGGDPRFMDRAQGNYRLSGASPCVNTGVNYLWTAADRDLDANPRILFRICDMGAYECTTGTSTLLILR